MVTYTDYDYKGYHVRHFSHDTESAELVWHRDRKDRYITPIGKTDWQIQFDNELPKPINDYEEESGKSRYIEYRARPP